MPSATRPSKVGQWTEPALRVLRERYLTRKDGEVVETPEEMCWRVARSIAAGEERYGRTPAAVNEIATAFYEMMIDQYFMPNSPTLMNAGKGNGLQYSACYVLPVGDSMPEIFDSVKAAAIIHQSGGGCIASDARVWSTFCGLEPIEVLVNRATADGRVGERSGAGVAFDVRDLNIETVSMDPKTGQPGLGRVTHVWRFDVPAEQQLLVTTCEGVQVQTSAWHPFMVVRPQGLVPLRADELQPGDVILGPDRPDDYWPYESPRRVGDLVIDDDIGWLIGFTLGDGSFGYVPSLRQYRLRWFSGARDVLEKVCAVLAAYDIRVSIQRDARGLLSVATLTQRFVLDMLEACGLEKIGAKDTRVRLPELIAKSPLSVVRAFIAGLMDSDGYVAADGSPSYATVSRGMAEDFAGLMSLLGYQPSVTAKAPHGKGRHTVYQVQLSALPQVNQLAKDIADHMASAHKVARLSSKSRRQTGLRLPFRPWRDRLKALGLIGSRRSGHGPCAVELNRWSCNENGRCRRDDLLSISEAVAARDAELARLLARVATRGLEVVTVRRAPKAKLFFDLSVEGWNTYAAGVHGMAFIHNTGFAFSRLRPKDDIVASTGGRASGPVSFLRVFNSATEAVKQGGTRRGANMGILKVDHPDILEFIECKLDGGITNFNISVAATEPFMDALAKGEEYELINPRTNQAVGRLSAKEVFERIVRAAWRTGDPGMVFIDRINASPANPTPEVGQIEATNPCIAGDTLVASDRGLLRMEQFAARYAKGGIAVKVDQRLLPSQLMVWEGTHNVPFSSYDHGCLPISQAFSSGERETVTVRTKAGFELTCTPDHRLMTERGWVEAGQLQIEADRVLIQSDAGMFAADVRLPFNVVREFRGRNGHTSRHDLPDSWSRDLGMVLGWLVGDGWLRAGDKNCRVGFTFGSGDVEMRDTIKTIVDRWYGRPVRIVERDRGVFHLSYHGKFFVDFFQALGIRGVPAEQKRVPEPLFTASREAVVGFLQALFTADGTVRDNPKSNSSWIALTSKSRDLLRDVQLLLLNLGIKSHIFDRSRAPRVSLFPPYETAAGPRTYGSDGVLFELGVFGKSREAFRHEIGFLNVKQERLGRLKYQGFYRQKFSDPVVAVESSGVRAVFDLTEPQSHSMIANGFVVHQCGEQPLLPNEACNLGSLNVAKFARRSESGELSIDWDEMERVVRLAVRFLDDVIEMNPYPLPEIDATVKANRRIGLGIMGWADLLYLLGIPYDSQEAVTLADQLMAFVKEKSHDQSSKLAEERGPFPNWNRSIYRNVRPMRNSTVTTIAPTGTISMIAGCSSGVEPIFALAFEHRVKQSDGERVLTFVNETFEKLAREQGFYSQALTEEIAKRGSLHDIPGLPERAKDVFKTSHEIAFEWHVRHQAAFQRYTDNGVSKTINLPNDATEDDVAHAYKLAWELGCLGITVFRDGCKGEQVLNVGVGKKKEQTPVPAVGGTATIKPRPHSLRGTTYRMETPIGTAFITVNETEGGDPFEVFLQVGKGGSDTMAVAEALGRLISLTLRMPSPLSTQRRLEEVISQLSRIGGAQPVGFGSAKVLSLPDALARCLAEHIGQIKPAGDAPAAQAKKTIGDLCKECGQATFVYEEGCKKCLSCGFNEC